MPHQIASSDGHTSTKSSYYSKLANIMEKAKASGISAEHAGAVYDEAIKVADCAITRGNDDTKQELAEMITWDKLFRAGDAFDHGYPLCKELEKNFDKIEKLELELELKSEMKDAIIKGIKAESHRQDEIIFELRSQLRKADVQQIGGHGVVRDGNIAAARIQGFQAYVENLQQQIHDLKHEMEVRLKDKDEKIAEKDVMIKDLNQTIHDLRNDLAQKVHAKKAEKTKNFKLNEQLKACQKDLSQKIKDMERLGALVDNSHGLDQGVNDNKRKADAASEEDPEVKRGKADDAETTE